MARRIPVESSPTIRLTPAGRRRLLAGVFLRLWLGLLGLLGLAWALA